MKRLDYSRKVRTVHAHARNAAEAVMFLAQFARERHRLHQERKSLERRMRKIEARLTEIAGTETRLVPVLQSGLRRPAVDGSGVAHAVVTPGGVMNATLQY